MVFGYAEDCFCFLERNRPILTALEWHHKEGASGYTWSSMQYMTRCNPMDPLYGALPVLYVPEPVTRGALVSHRYTYAPPHCRTSQYSRTFIPLSVSLWNHLANPVFDDVGLAGFKSRANSFLLT